MIVKVAALGQAPFSASWSAVTCHRFPLRDMSRSGKLRHAGAVQMPGRSQSITLRGLQQTLSKLKCGRAEVFPEEFRGGMVTFRNDIIENVTMRGR